MTAVSLLPSGPPSHDGVLGTPTESQDNVYPGGPIHRLSPIPTHTILVKIVALKEMDSEPAQLSTRLDEAEDQDGAETTHRSPYSQAHVTGQGTI